MKIPTKTLCQEYYERMSKRVKILENMTKVTHDWDLTDYNLYIFGLKNNPPREDIKAMGRSDFEFKHLVPTKKDLVLWRGIFYYEGASHQKQFEKLKNSKPGDIIFMPEYAYASDSKVYSEGFTGKNGILYRINVPKGAKLSQSTKFVFPRASKFICTANSTVEHNNKSYNLIDIDYCIPDKLHKQIDTQPQKKKNIFSKMYDKISHLFK